ncbi:MAG: amidohydrolase family protein [Hymenobacteraceae bacterium]|nr:amidohydrolase family protein [Hymenobacteraceae bacterium]
MTLFKSAVRAMAVLALPALLASCQATGDDTTDTTYALLIKNARVVDGTGSAPYVANLLINGDSIALIDRDTTNTYTATSTINAQGMVVSPGFIDTHAHGDPLETPEFENFLAMGVTTICLGQDGASPGEKDLRAWMDRVDQVRPAVNIAMFAGHGTLRMLSGVGYDSIPSAENSKALDNLLIAAMDAGCFGMTTGLEYTPGYIADSAELNRLAKIVGEKNGLIMSHMRNEDNDAVEASIRELLEQGRYCPVQVSHIKVVFGKGEKRAQEILQLLDSARTSGTQVTADFYPYTASYTGIAILFPEWAQKPNDYQQVLRTKRAELGEFLRNKVNQRNGPEATLIGSGPYKGKTLAQVAKELGKPFERVLMEDIGPYGASGAYFVMNEPLQEALLRDPHVMVCTDGSPTMHHPRGYGAFAKVIETYVEDKKMLTLEEAIRKMTGLPAKTLGLPDRGVIRPGYKADLVVFNPSAVKENATYENPRQLATGFSYVLMNGKIVKENDTFSENRQGRVLKKNQL